MSDQNKSTFVPPFGPPDQERNKPTTSEIEEAAKVHPNIGRLKTANSNFIPPFAPPSFYSANTSIEDTAEPADDVARVAEGLVHPHINDTRDKVSSIQKVSTGTKVGAAVPGVDQASAAPNAQSLVSVRIADPIDDDELEEIQQIAHEASCIMDLPDEVENLQEYIIDEMVQVGLNTFKVDDDLRAKSLLFEISKAVKYGNEFLGKYEILKGGDMYYLIDQDRKKEFNLMRKKGYIPKGVPGQRFYALEKGQARLGLEVFKSVVETSYKNTTILIDGVFQAYLKENFENKTKEEIMVGAIAYLKTLKKFAYEYKVGIIVPLYSHNKLERQVTKELITFSNEDLTDTAISIKKRAATDEYRLTVTRSGEGRKTINTLWSVNGWTIKPKVNRGRKPKVS